MRNSLLVVLALLQLAMATAAHAAAQPAVPVGLAKKYFELGKQHCAAKHYREAIAAWEDAAAIVQSPALHCNIGQAWEKLERIDKAITEYQFYLLLNPKASDRRQVELRIARLREEVRADAAPENSLHGPVLWPPSHKVTLLAASGAAALLLGVVVRGFASQGAASFQPHMGAGEYQQALTQLPAIQVLSVSGDLLMGAGVLLLATGASIHFIPYITRGGGAAAVSIRF